MSSTDIIDEILRQFAPKVPRDTGPHQWTEDEYTAAEIHAQEEREVNWQAVCRADQEHKHAHYPLSTTWLVLRDGVEEGRATGRGVTKPLKPT